MCGEVLGYCGTSSRNFVHPADIEHSSYVHLNELLSGKIVDVCDGLHQDNNGNNFVGGFVTNEMLFYPNIIPHVDVLHAYIAQQFGFNAYTLKRSLMSSYDDEVN